MTSTDSQHVCLDQSSVTTIAASTRAFNWVNELAEKEADSSSSNEIGVPIVESRSSMNFNEIQVGDSTIHHRSPQANIFTHNIGGPTNQHSSSNFEEGGGTGIGFLFPSKSSGSISGGTATLHFSPFCPPNNAQVLLMYAKKTVHYILNEFAFLPKQLTENVMSCSSCYPTTKSLILCNSKKLF